jgi:hypothetical protein
MGTFKHVNTIKKKALKSECPMTVSCADSVALRLEIQCHDTHVILFFS